MTYRVLAGKEPNPEKIHLLRFDGGAKPNPGEMCGGAVLYTRMSGAGPASATAVETEVFKLGFYEPSGTNNRAEYSALIRGLEQCVARGVKQLYIEGDSMLVVKHLTGEYKVKKADLLPYYEKCKKLIQGFEYVGIKQVPRMYNHVADALANKAFDLKHDFME